MELIHGLSRGAVSLLMLIVVVSCSRHHATDPNDASPGPNEVWMQNMSFRPDELTIPSGSSIVWTNKDNVNHSITSGRFGKPLDLFESGDIAPGSSYTQPFDSTGTYHYYCRLHPLQMTGIINVTDGSDAAGTIDIAF